MDDVVDGRDEINRIYGKNGKKTNMLINKISVFIRLVNIATKKSHYDKVVSNIQEIKARYGKIIAVVTEGDTTVKEIPNYVIEIPETEEAFTSLLTTIPLQLLSYIAVMLDKNVDQPRNLAKSVTVE